jgi:hypothetical protein
MNLTRLAYTQHPRPPQRELRQRSVFDSERHLIGHVENIYVDEARDFQFVGIVMRGFLGLGKNRHLIPVDAIAEEDLDAITRDPHAAPDEALQRAAREHCQGKKGLCSSKQL